MSLLQKLRTRSVVLGAAALVLVACRSSQITSTWRDPTAGKARFEKVAALAVMSNEADRRAAEDEMVKQIRTTTAVPAYTLLAGNELAHRAAVETKLRASGCDGVVVLRLAKGSEGALSTPGGHPPSYSMFGSYYDMAQPQAHDPTYLREMTVVRVETNIYSLVDQKLVFACFSETADPHDWSDLVERIAKAVSAELESRGLLVERD